MVRFSHLTATAVLSALFVTGCDSNQWGDEVVDVGTHEQAFSGTRATVTSNFSSWKASYVEDVPHCGGATPCKRVARRDEGNDTVSEGIAYGMLLAAYLDDRSTLDGLWNYYRTHVNAHGVMHWKWSASNTMTGENEATDAVEDAAIALIVADRKGWGTPAGDGQTYNARAKDLIGKILTYFITANNETKPGDATWEVWERTYNPSYMIAPYATVFAQYTGNTRWNSVKDKDYALLGLLDNNDAGARTTGLVPDWMYFNGTQNYNGAVLSNDINWDKTNTGAPRVWWFSYDSCRQPWRIAMDWAWHGDSRAGARLDKLNAWASPKNGNILNGYYLNGTEPPTSEYPAGTKAVLGAFVGPFAAASVKASQSYQDTMWNKLVSLGQGSNYFSDTVRMLGLAFVSGNMPNPLSIGSGGGGACSLVNNATYGIKALHSGRFMDAAGLGTTDGTNIQQYGLDSNGTHRQFVAVDVGGGYWSFRNVNAGRYLDINGGTGAIANGDNLQLWGTSNTQANRQFKVEAGPNGGCLLKPRHTITAGATKCIDVAGISMEDGANIYQWNCHGGSNQDWVFQRK